MAKIFPDHLPESILSDPKRNAEKKVFEALSGLVPSFVVFYSVAWQARKDGYTRDGEADFIIAHSDYGVLVLEVKGGGVAYDAINGQWTTTDRYGESFVIDPVEQAKKSHYTLLDKFKDLPEWDSSRFLTIGHAVCFPDVVVDNKLLRLDLSRDIVIDHNDLGKIDETIQRIFEHYGDKNRCASLGRDRLAIVESLLARSFNIKTPLGVELDKEDKRLIELTEQQFGLLGFLASRRRALIAGCAGSGKTMLAVEKARQLNEQGFNVLLTCFNSALAEDLAKRLPDITVMHFHGLCREVAKEVGFTIQAVTDQQKYYDETLPEMLLKVVDETGPMFDAIIVDEAQDFMETYWVALASLLNDKEGIFYVFYDDNQNLYGGDLLKGIVNDESFLLSENCRNTKAIHKVVSSFYSDRKRLSCKGPEGRPPEFHAYRESAEMLKGVQSVLNKLVNEEHVAAEDIVILTPHAQEKTALKIGSKLGNFTLTDVPPQRRNEIQATTIYKFKGLERKVVIIAEVDDRFKHNPETLMYVGSSRARTHLLFFVSQNAPAEIKSQIEAACKPTR